MEEYGGMTACVNAACHRLVEESWGDSDTLCVFQLDSMLVSKQGSFKWRCLSMTLAPYYDRVVARIRRLEEAGVRVVVMHIYREFNTLADGLANEVLDSGREVSEGWYTQAP